MSIKKKLIIIIPSIIFVLIVGVLGTSQLKQIIKASISYVEVIELKESADTANITGLELIDEGQVEEGLVYFQEALDYANQCNEKVNYHWSQEIGTLLSNAYNNIGYAYYLLNDYEASKENLEKSLSIKPNDAFEYSNMGNTYYQLYDNEEAMKNYDLAIRVDNDAEYAYYGKGLIYYNQAEYEDALQMFDRYLDYEANDEDAKLYIIYCYLYLDNTEEALNQVKMAIKEYDTNIDFYIAKGDIYTETKSYEEVNEYYENLANLFKNDVSMQISVGEYYYNNKEFQSALNHFTAAKERFPDNTEIDSWVISCYSALNDMVGASTYFQKVEASGNVTYQLCDDIGNAYINSTLYMESIPYFEKAISLDPELQDSYLNILSSLYYGKRYSRCIEYGRTIEERFETVYDIPAFMGDSYYALGEFEDARVAYMRALALSPDNEDLLALIGECYLMLEDLEKAEEFSNETLAINSENMSAQNTRAAIISRQGDIGSVVKDFFKDNYLYYEANDYEANSELEKKIDTLFSKEDMTNLDIAIAVDEMRLSEDMFTFTLFDEYYDECCSGVSSEVEYHTYEDINYIRIYEFDQKTDSQVIEILDTIEDPENKILAIDLRGNGGGLLQGASNILDVLLTDCVLCTLFYKDGTTYNYYSDASQIKFKKVFVLVDENSASASELLTLGLRTYLDNVTVIGRNTFGKGVGQTIFEIKERKLNIFLVNFYWNVRQQNIMGTNITPDIYLKSDDLEDYLKIMRK